MELFTYALLIVFCVRAALGTDVPVQQPNQPERQLSTSPVQVAPYVQLSEPRPMKPIRPSLVEDFISRVEEKLRRIPHTFVYGNTGVADDVGGRRKKLIAKVVAYKAGLEAKIKSIVIPDSPESARNAALSMKLAINKAIRELDDLKAELMKCL